MNIPKILNSYIEPEFILFQEKICKTHYQILGIKIPNLRKISKELMKKYSKEEILSNLNDQYFEHIILEGFIIANSKVSYEEKINLIKNYLPKIDSWAICDVFVSELEFIKHNQQSFWEFLEFLLKSKEEFTIRFVIVCFLNYYLNDEYFDLVLEKTLEIKNDAYYVKMAISWCLSICLIKNFEKTINFLQKNQNKFDKWTYNKALQKGRESFKISKENKITLQKMKLK